MLILLVRLLQAKRCYHHLKENIGNEYKLLPYIPVSSLFSNNISSKFQICDKNMIKNAFQCIYSEILRDF